MVKDRSERDRSGASKGRESGLVAWLQNYVLRHAQTLFYALGQLSQKPFSTLMTTAVIGIALAMPTGLYVLLQSVQQVPHGWDDSTRISLFLHRDISEDQATALAEQLRKRPDIASVNYVSRAHALNEFRRLSGFDAALDALEDNPLPATLVVHPVVGKMGGVDQIEHLLEELRDQAEIDLVQLDMQWVRRLFALMEIGRRGVALLAGLLALAVLLVVGNTIRLAIQNRRDEIVIIKLIGGTDSFIRRPFLYIGLWYGVFGCFCALIMVEASLFMLQEPIQNLAILYNSDFGIHSLDLKTGALLFVSSVLLGLIGSWIAVGRHLRAIEPT